MPNPYSRVYEITTASDQHAAALPFLYRGTLTRLHVRQVTGSLEGYTATLYSSAQALPTAVSSASSFPGNPATAAEMWQIVPQQTAEPGDNEVRWDGETAFMNQDGTPTLGVRRLYLLLEPSGGVDKVFQVALSAYGADV